MLRICLLALVLPQARADDVATDARAAFARLHARQPAWSTLAAADGAALAWGESYRLAAYVAMYEATGERRWLAVARTRIDAVLAIRSDRRGLRDDVRGKLMPAWVSSRYTDGKAYAWLVHAGMVAAPIARWAYVVRRDPALRRELGAHARYYVREATAVVDGFASAWRGGHYHGDYLRRALPLNQGNALGRAHVALWLATGETRHRDRAAAMARYLRARLRLRGTRYVWNYWPDRGPAEDISHAAINVDFAVACARARLIFSATDMRRFAATLRHCARPDGFTLRVDGTGDRRYSAQIGRWGRLPGVRSEIHAYMRSRWTQNVTTGLTAAAYLAQTRAVADTPVPPTKK